MSEILHLTVKDFIAATAAKQPTPGGGSVAALTGALAASLAAMAVEYSLGKKSFAAHDPEHRRALASLHAAANLLQELIAEDIAAYQALSELLKLPPDLRNNNPDYLPAVVATIRAPQTTAAIALNILSLCQFLTDKTGKYLLSDLAIAATYAHATVLASEFNVRANLALLPNPEEAAAIKSEISALSAKADALLQNIRTELLAKI